MLRDGVEGRVENGPALIGVVEAEEDEVMMGKVTTENPRYLKRAGGISLRNRSLWVAKGADLGIPSTADNFEIAATSFLSCERSGTSDKLKIKCARRTSNDGFTMRGSEEHLRLKLQGDKPASLDLLSSVDSACAAGEIADQLAP